MSSFQELLARHAAVDLVANYCQWISYEEPSSYNIFKQLINKFANGKVELVSEDVYDNDLSSIKEGRKKFTKPEYKGFKRYSNKKHFINSTNMFLNFVSKDTPENRGELWSFLSIPYDNKLLKIKLHELDL